MPQSFAAARVVIVASACALVLAQSVTVPAQAADAATLIEVSVVDGVLSASGGASLTLGAEELLRASAQGSSTTLQVWNDAGEPPGPGTALLWSADPKCALAPTSAPVASISCTVTQASRARVDVSATASNVNAYAVGSLELTFRGGSGANDVYGGTGRDDLGGGGGNDNLFGDPEDGVGNADTLYGGDGDDDIEGGPGDDSIVGGSGVDGMFGDDGVDTIDAKDGIKDAAVDCGAAGKYAIWDQGLDTPVRCEAFVDESTLLRVSIEPSTSLPGTSVLVVTAGANIPDFTTDEYLLLEPLAAGADVTVSRGSAPRLYSIESACTRAPAASPQRTIACRGIRFTAIRVDLAASGAVTRTQVVRGDLPTTFLGGSGPDDFTGGEGPDDVYGGDGGDTLSGRKGDDSIRGEGGPDTVYGGDHADTVSGGDMNDRLFGEAGDDKVDGGPGPDSLSGGSGTNFIMAKDGDRDSLNCGTFDNPGTARYDKGLDSLSSCIDAPDETNTFRVATAANPAGGAPIVTVVGADRTAYFPAGEALTLERWASSAASEGVTVSFPTWARLWTDSPECGAVPPDQPVATITCVGTFASASVDASPLPNGARITVKGSLPSTIVGSRHDDEIVGGTLADVIESGEGDDDVDAGPGADFVKGGPGRDTVYGRAGRDTLLGEAGVDTLRGGPDGDQVDGGPEPDRLYGDAGKDYLQARDGIADWVVDCEDGGSDLPKGGIVTFDQGLDRPVACTEAATESVAVRVSVDGATVAVIAGDQVPAFATSEAVVVSPVDGGVEVTVRDGSPRLWSDAVGCTPVPVAEPEAAVTCTGTFTSAHVDFSTATSAVHLVSEGDLDSTLRGGAGPDILETGSGKDAIEGSSGADEVTSGDGDDEVRSGPGADTVKGGAGADAIDGQDGNDLLFGEAGSDTVRGGPGRDSIDGGTDVDVLYGDAAKDSLNSEDGIVDGVVDCDGGDTAGGGIVVYDVGLDIPVNCTPVASSQVMTSTGAAWGGLMAMPITDADTQVNLTANAISAPGSFYGRSKSQSPSQANNGLIGFQSDRDGTGNRIYVMNADGSNVRQLTFIADAPYANENWGYAQDTGPVISPDGTRVAFLSQRPYFADPKRDAACGIANGIVIVDIATKKLRTVVTPRWAIQRNRCYVSTVHSLDWNDDGTRLAYRSAEPEREAGSSEYRLREVITFVDATGVNAKSYGAAPCADTLIDWVGEKVLTSYGCSEAQLRIWNLRTNAITTLKGQLLNAGVGDGSFGTGQGAVRLSANGTRLMFLMGTWAGSPPRPTFVRSMAVDGTAALDTGAGIKVAGDQWIWWSPRALPPAASYAISPARVTIARGGAPVQLRPALKDLQGRVLSVSGTDWQFAEGSPGALGIAVSQTGLLTVDESVPPGVYVIENTNASLAARVTITVT